MDPALPDEIPILNRIDGVIARRFGLVQRRHSSAALVGLVRERMQREPRSRALFVFFGKRRQTVKVLSWGGTGTVLWYKRLDAGLFESPRPSAPGATSVMLSEIAFEACRRRPRRGPPSREGRAHPSEGRVRFRGA